MPLPSGRVIPAGWSAHHQPVSESAMTIKVRIEVPGTGSATFSDTTGYTTGPAPAVLYTGKARLMTPLRPTKANLAEQDTSTEDYTLAIPADAPEIPYAATVIVTEAPNDLPMVGRRLFVQSSALSFERFETVLALVETATPGTT